MRRCEIQNAESLQCQKLKCHKLQYTWPEVDLKLDPILQYHNLVNHYFLPNTRSVGAKIATKLFELTANDNMFFTSKTKFQ